MSFTIVVYDVNIYIYIYIYILIMSHNAMASVKLANNAKIPLLTVIVITYNTAP